MSDKRTSIQILESTRVKLLKLGSKGETYDDILNRLLDESELFVPKNYNIREFKNYNKKKL